MGKPTKSEQGQHQGAGGEEVVRVVYVRKEYAKTAKNFLKDGKFLDDRFRMLPATATALDNVDAFDFDSTTTLAALIAIPVTEEFDKKTIFSGGSYDNDDSDSEKDTMLPSSLFVGVGYQTCPYSTKMLGNCRANHHKLSNSKSKLSTRERGNGTAALPESLTLSQSLILEYVLPSAATTTGSSNGNEALIRSGSSSLAMSDNNHDEFQSSKSIIDRVLQLDSTVCPGSRRRPFLEIFGDDRTVVVPPGAFEGEEFISILRDVRPFSTHLRTTQQQNRTNDSGDSKDDHGGCDIDAGSDNIDLLYDDFWRRLALAHNSPRVVRRGGIDPNSRIRESGHRILWPNSQNSTTNDLVTGPQSPSWIRVTEQGIKQSFDLTKVMFSRGNISEKIRFGKQLVREGEVVLDLYAGIGYYTLPAVIHGKASKVYACEWNQNAVDALRFNIRDNKIEDKVEIFVGDCRESVEANNIVNIVDRVSLGLLPSSEGGWRAAVRALKAPYGGWLHVHANVPASEMESWTLWLCHRLDVLAREENRPNDWRTICNHVERVKSFAPTVFHYVADVFVGIPASDASNPIGEAFLQETDEMTLSTDVSVETGNGRAKTPTCRAWMRKSSNHTWIPALKDMVVTPSCALSPDGVLSQDWMR
mmetsp:Transcript_23158/g.54672  ORF Transcript_23158/g.54672 Transcript_23158/m.54672 type:complete len:644 (-) Transcript_23158:186-2117(-)